MKKIYALKVMILMVSAIILSSCSTDNSGETNGTTTGNYFPMAVNNKWNYTDGSTATEVKLIGTTTFGGVTYYEMTDDANELNNLNWIAKKGASYFQKAGATTSIEGGTTISAESYEVKILRDDLDVGEHWNGSAKPNVTYSGSSGSGSFRASITYQGNVIAKGVSETLDGVTYNDIIKVTVSAVVNSNGTINTINSEYWFAKDIGIIYDSATSTVDNITKTRHLTSYELN